METKTISTVNLRRNRIIAGSTGVGVLVASSPVMAQTATGDIAQVQSTITTLGTIGSAIGAIVVTVMGLRMAIKLVNRVATKG